MRQDLRRRDQICGVSRPKVVVAAKITGNGT